VPFGAPSGQKVAWGTHVKRLAWIATLLAIFGSQAKAEEELPPQAELLEFIYDSLSSSIPGEWEQAWMEADLSTKDGRENISVKYFYLSPGSSEPRKFTVSNTFGPPNAASYLQKIAQREGKPMSKFRVDIKPGGKVRLTPL
jgi:hypothetical protein